jgi:hypothetical protein
MEDDMSTPQARTPFSFAATLLMTLTLGACVAGPSRPASHGPTPVTAAPLAIRFDNGDREHVHVYLVGQRREWLLGRVEPGATTTLRLPDASLADDPGFVQLAVVPGGRVTQRAARDPRAKLTIAQSASAIMSRQWRFAQGELTSPVPRADRGVLAAQ